MKMRLSVSVVDDDEPVRKALRRLVGSAGFNVVTFASGIQFLEYLKAQHTDCAIVDLHLPGLSGLQVQQQLSRDHASLPLIMITGRDEPGLRDQVREAGAAAFLCKPVEKAVLLETIALVTGAVPEPSDQSPAPTGANSSNQTSITEETQ